MGLLHNVDVLSAQYCGTKRWCGKMNNAGDIVLQV